MLSHLLSSRMIFATNFPSYSTYLPLYRLHIYVIPNCLRITRFDFRLILFLRCFYPQTDYHDNTRTTDIRNHEQIVRDGDVYSYARVDEKYKISLINFPALLHIISTPAFSHLHFRVRVSSFTYRVFQHVAFSTYFHPGNKTRKNHTTPRRKSQPSNNRMYIYVI